MQYSISRTWRKFRWHSPFQNYHRSIISRSRFQESLEFTQVAEVKFVEKHFELSDHFDLISRSKVSRHIAASMLKRLYKKFQCGQLHFNSCSDFQCERNFKCTVSCTMKMMVLLKAVTARFGKGSYPGFDSTLLSESSLLRAVTAVGKGSYPEGFQYRQSKGRPR